MNLCVLIGRLTRDPELRYTASGTPVGNFTLAVDRPPQKDGTKEADFLRVVVWGPIAENCSKYIGKGSLVAVEGRIQVRSYESQGEKKTATEIVANSVQFLDKRTQAEEG